MLPVRCGVLRQEHRILLITQTFGVDEESLPCHFVVPPLLAPGHVLLGHVGADDHPVRSVGVLDAVDDRREAIVPTLLREADDHQHLGSHVGCRAGRTTGLVLLDRVVTLVEPLPDRLGHTVDTETDGVQPVAPQSVEDPGVPVDRALGELRSRQHARLELDAMRSGGHVSDPQHLFQLVGRLQPVQVGEVHVHLAQAILREEARDVVDLIFELVEAAVFLALTLGGCAEVAPVRAALGREETELSREVCLEELRRQALEHGSHRDLESSRNPLEREVEGVPQVLVVRHVANIAVAVSREDAVELVMGEARNALAADQHRTLVPHLPQLEDEFTDAGDDRGSENCEPDPIASHDDLTRGRIIDVGQVEVEDVDLVPARLEESAAEVHDGTRQVDLDPPRIGGLYQTDAFEFLHRIPLPLLPPIQVVTAHTTLSNP